jgi:hypothetical protein
MTDLSSDGRDSDHFSAMQENWVLSQRISPVEQMDRTHGPKYPIGCWHFVEVSRPGTTFAFCILKWNSALTKLCLFSDSSVKLSLYLLMQ